MKHLKKIISNPIHWISIVAGACLCFAFAPFEIAGLAILSPAILLGLWRKQSAKQAFVTGLFYGLGCFGASVSWVFVSIHYFGHAELPLAVFLTGGFVAIMALYPAMQGYCLKRFYPNNGWPLALIGFPCSWVLFEALRGWFLTGFPWLFLGYSQIDTPLAALAPIIGVYGIGFITALIAGCLVLGFQQSGYRRYSLFSSILLVYAGCFFLAQLQWTTPTSNNQRVALIQSSLSPSERFTTRDPVRQTWEAYGPLTLKHGQNVDLIVWPENSLTLEIPHSEGFLSDLNTLAKKQDFHIILGLPKAVKPYGPYYNSMVLLGKNKGIYYKRNLVPFGEYVPFDFLRGLLHSLQIPMSDFIPGPKEQKVWQVGEQTMAPLLCYEIAYPELVRQSAKDSQLLVVTSEEGWFGDSFGPHQHLQMTRMRALETGRYVLRSANQGISAIVAPNGKIIHQSEQFKHMAISGEFQYFTGMTPWVQIGLLPLVILLTILFFSPFVLARRLVSGFAQRTSPDRSSRLRGKA